MKKPHHRYALWLAALLAVPLAAWGCKGKSSPTQPTPPPSFQPPGGGPAGPGAGGGEGGPGQIMNRIGKGPNSLDSLLKSELQAAQPDWTAIQPQADEYAKLAAELGKASPAKGSQESWAKQTAAFSESATALDTAAKAKDLSAAKAAQDKLGSSCMECHQAHRGGRGGPGGPGGPGGRRGFGPPGGPSGPPPG